jgi:alkyldihydroxyacetonephosphate synthase
LGAFSDTMEVAAPWSKLQAVYEAVRAALGEYVLVLAHLSHAYPDGCSIYFTFSGVENGEVGALYDRAWRAALTAAIDAGATLSHHHGVGRSKAPLLGRELGLGVELVQRTMKACDPDGILNPGALRSRADAGVNPAPFDALSAKLPLEIDSMSQFVTARGDMFVSGVEAELLRRGFTLGLSTSAPEQKLDDWIAQGLPGTRNPWQDPVSSSLCGLHARLHSQETLHIRAAPRRAVGPDLTALFVGAHAKVGHVEQVTLPIFATQSPRARTLAFAGDANPALTDGEAQLFERCVSSVLTKT